MECGVLEKFVERLELFMVEDDVFEQKRRKMRYFLLVARELYAKMVHCLLMLFVVLALVEVEMKIKRIDGS